MGQLRDWKKRNQKVKYLKDGRDSGFSGLLRLFYFIKRYAGGQGQGFSLKKSLRVRASAGEA